MNKAIVVPANELLAAQEKGFNKLTEIGNQCMNNPFKYMTSVNKLFAEIYSTAFNSGYRQSELDTIIKKEE